ncbi:hypothetical protein BX600DRAFT_443188 [Xylariales sp. PMI_506]|nr:hypothetical protein BX600DRAFT_443188 [Xylariales sp. PMI_506]
MHYPISPFPQVLEAYYKWNVWGYFHLYSAGKDKKLFTVAVHTGYSNRGPLGSRMGVLLHNGVTSKDPIFAAATDESPWAVRVYAFSLNSVILLPPIEAKASAQAVVEEFMTARTVDGNGVGFYFSIEVGEKLRRQEFEWCKTGARGSAGSSSASPSTSPGNVETEVFARFQWTKTITNLTHPFNLQFLEKTVSVRMGDRWTLMVVVTALRLWALRSNGRTNHKVVATAEKFHRRDLGVLPSKHNAEEHQYNPKVPENLYKASVSLHPSGFPQYIDNDRFKEARRPDTVEEPQAWANVPSYNFDLCHDEAVGVSITSSIPAGGVAQFNNVPAACMDLVVVLSGSC